MLLAAFLTVLLFELASKIFELPETEPLQLITVDGIILIRNKIKMPTRGKQTDQKLKCNRKTVLLKTRTTDQNSK